MGKLLETWKNTEGSNLYIIYRGRDIVRDFSNLGSLENSKPAVVVEPVCREHSACDKNQVLQNTVLTVYICIYSMEKKKNPKTLLQGPTKFLFSEYHLEISKAGHSGEYINNSYQSSFIYLPMYILR